MTGRARPRGVEIPNLKPGSPEWATKMSASKIAAVLDLSPFESPFSLWHKMAGTIPWGDDKDILRRGHYLEPALRQWWRDNHAGHVVERTATFAHPTRPWQIASPDGLVQRRVSDRPLVAVLECKTANNDWEWGAQDSDEIPLYYRKQGMWQMDVVGVDVCYFSVLTSYMEFRQYELHYDAAEAAQMREAAQAFLGTLAAGQAPPLDGHDQTYRAVRTLHPDIDDVKVELDPGLIVDYVNAIVSADVATAAKKAVTVRVAEAMGTARHGIHVDGTTVAYRMSKNGGTPYVVAGRGLTTKFTLDQEAKAS